MKIKNIGRKIIGFGNIAVLPGESKEIDDVFAENPMIGFYKNNKMVEVLSDDSKDDKVPEEDDDTGGKTDDNLPDDPDELKKTINAMTREPLLELAEKEGVEIDKDDKVPDIKVKLLAHFGIE